MKIYHYYDISHKVMCKLEKINATTTLATQSNLWSEKGWIHYIFSSAVRESLYFPYFLKVIK